MRLIPAVSGVRIPAPPPRIPVNRTNPFEQKLSAALEQVPSLRPGQRLLVALSGGADSCALLLGLLHFPHYPLIIAHYDHDLRASSERDRFFARICPTVFRFPSIGSAQVVPPHPDFNIGRQKKPREWNEWHSFTRPCRRPVQIGLC